MTHAEGGRCRAWRPLSVLLIAVTLLAPGLAAGQPVARELTAAESVRLGLAHNGRVRAADADAAAAQAAHREARAGLLPALRTQASYTRLGGGIPAAEFTLPGLDTTFTLLPIERDRFHTELLIEQPLFAGGRLRHSAQAAARGAAAAERLAEQERVDLALEVRRAYWTLYGALGVLAATDAAESQVEAHLRDVRSRYEAGALLRSDVLSAQARRSGIALDRLEADNAVRLARLELNRLIGLPAGTEVRPVAAPDAGPLPPDPAALAAHAASERPQIQALAEEVAALRAQAAAARGGRLPEVAAVGRYIYARPNPYVFTEQGTFRGTWEAGVALRWGVWEGGAQEARAAQARERLRAAEERLEYARELVALEVMRGYLDAQRATAAVAVAAEHMAQAAEALRVVRQQFEEGVTLSAAVLDAEHEYRAAQARHARAEAEHALARAALRHAQGEVW